MYLAQLLSLSIAMTLALSAAVSVAEAQGVVKTDGQSPAGQVESSVLGFQTWKASRVEEARNVLERLTTDGQLDRLSGPDRSPTPQTSAKGEAKKSQARPAAKGGRADQRVQQAQLNVEIAEELSVNDYFILYLSQLKSRDAFVEVARKLSPEEIADLILAYQKSLTTQSVALELANPSLPPKLGPTTSTASSRAP